MTANIDMSRMVIRTGIPTPAPWKLSGGRRKWPSFPLDQLAVGDCVDLPLPADEKARVSLRSAVYNQAALHGVTVTTRTLGENGHSILRVWRIEDEGAGR